MIKLGDYKYIKNNAAAVDTLFDKDGTFYGFYKHLKNRILFMDMQKQVFAALVKNRDGYHLVNATKLDNGNTYYQYGLGKQHYKELNMPSNDSYITEREYIDALGKKLIDDK